MGKVPSSTAVKGAAGSGTELDVGGTGEGRGICEMLSPGMLLL